MARIKDEARGTSQRGMRSGKKESKQAPEAAAAAPELPDSAQQAPGFALSKHVTSARGLAGATDHTSSLARQKQSAGEPGWQRDSQPRKQAGEPESPQGVSGRQGAVPMSESGVALTMDFIPGLYPTVVHSLNQVQNLPVNQRSTNHTRQAVQSMADQRRQVEALGLAAQVESVYARQGVPPSQRLLQAKPAKTVSMFYEDQFHYIQVEPKDVKGELIAGKDELGVADDIYVPIDFLDVSKGVNPTYLQMCPPKLQRALKLRAAGLTRRRAEVRTAEKWAKIKREEISVLKDEYKSKCEVAEIKANLCQSLVKTMDEHPLQRMATKRKLRQELEKLEEATKDATRKEEDLSKATHHLMHLKGLIVATRYQIALAEEAHSRDCQRMHAHVEARHRHHQAT